MRMCTSVAPASRIAATNLRLVVPRTIESSITTTRFPANTSGRGLSFTRIPASRIAWVG